MTTIPVKIPWQVCYYSCHGNALVEMGWLSQGTIIQVGPTQKFALRRQEVEASAFRHLGQVYYVVAQNLGDTKVREKIRRLSRIHLVASDGQHV